MQQNEEKESKGHKTKTVWLLNQIPCTVSFPFQYVSVFLFWIFLDLYLFLFGCLKSVNRKNDYLCVFTFYVLISRVNHGNPTKGMKWCSQEW
jgi:hypothetical protein